MPLFVSPFSFQGQPILAYEAALFLILSIHAHTLICPLTVTPMFMLCHMLDLENVTISSYFCFIRLDSGIMWENNDQSNM